MDMTGRSYIHALNQKTVSRCCRRKLNSRIERTLNKSQLLSSAYMEGKEGPWEGAMWAAWSTVQFCTGNLIRNSEPQSPPQKWVQLFTVSLTCSVPGPGCNRLLCEYKGRSLNYGEAMLLQRKWDASRTSWTWEWSQKKRRFQPLFLFPSGALETACLLDWALCPRKQREWEHLPQNCREHRMRYPTGPWSPRKDVHVHRKATLDKITFQYFNGIVFTTRWSTLPFLTSLQNGVPTEFEPLMEEYFSSSHTTLKPRVFLVEDVFLHYSVHVAAQVVVAQSGGGC